MAAFPMVPVGLVASVLQSNVDKKSKDGEDSVRLLNYTDVYYNDKIDLSHDFMVATASTEQIERLKLQVGDVVITKDSETADDIGIPALVSETADDFVCAYHLSILRPDASKVTGDYLFWCMKSKPTVNYWESRANGVTRVSIPSTTVTSLKLPLPDLDTQRRIADYLDKETAQIDTLVAELDGYVELLEKRERTRLDNLLSTYPVSKLGHFWTVTDCLHVTAPFVDEDSGCDNNYVVSIEQLGKREIDLSKANQTTDDAFAELRRGGREPRDGDIIMSRNASVGKCSIVGGEAAGIALGQDVVLMSPQGEQSSQLLYYFLNTSLLQSSISKVSVGSTFKRINVAQIKSLPFPVIPKEGQDHLVTRIEAELTRTDTIITQCRELKELLLKRRQVLITDVVTGKVEV